MLGMRIALCRKMRGLSQAELAERLGLSPSAVGMYEQGLRTPSIAILISLAREFDISLHFLITGFPYAPNPSIDGVLPSDK